MPVGDELLTLSRYFVWADAMRKHFEETLKRNGPDLEGPGGIYVAMYMSLWYGCRYVVVEAWQSLGLRNSRVDDLLASPNVELLRRYRNAVFHYQKELWPEKFMAFLREGESTAVWVRTLHNAIDDYLAELLNDAS
jgi:hypothetical protein